MDRTLALALAFFFALYGHVSCQAAVLRYTEESCKSLAPVYKDESYADVPGLGPPPTDPTNSGQQSKPEVFETPKKLTTISPPFRIELDSSHYRRHGHYQVHLMATEYFDSFMIGAIHSGTPESTTAAPISSNNSNSSSSSNSMPFFGSWLDPSPGGLAILMSCGGNKSAAVVDKARPVHLGNVSLIWEAPGENVGSIVIEASVAFRDAYVTVQSLVLPFQEPTVNTGGCGSTAYCFRSCRFRADCDADGAFYMLIADVAALVVNFKLGAYLPDMDSYAAVGFGKDKNMKQMEFVTCSKRATASRVVDNVVNDLALGIEHYYMENPDTIPVHHKAAIQMTKSEREGDTNFVWCEFSRALAPKNAFDLDLAAGNMYFFYFWGELDNNSIPIIPEQDKIMRTYQKDIAAARVYNEIEFKPEKYSSGQSALALDKVMAIVATAVILSVCRSN